MSWNQNSYWALELPFDDPDLAGMTVGDVLDDPPRFAGETLADPIEGVEDGRCKARIMWDGVGPPFIHSFAHGYATYQLRYDAAGVQARIARTDAADVVAAMVRLAGMADLNAVETSALVHEVAERAEVGVRAVQATLKEGLAEQREQRVAAARERWLAERSDPRPLQKQPMDDAEWLPVMDAINVVAAAVDLVRRPRRDIDGTITHQRQMPIGLTHAFSNANEEEKTDDQPASS